MDHSLPQVFGRNAQVNLTSVNHARAHKVGTIQNTGGLLMLDEGSQCVMGASENLADLIGVDAVSALGRPLATMVPALAAELQALAKDACATPEVLTTTLDAKEGVFELMAHAHQGQHILEFIPNSDPCAVAARKRLLLSSKACAQIIQAPDFATALDCAARFVRQITGYEQINICRFLPDWSATIDASNGALKAPSPLGLSIPKEHFLTDLHAMKAGMPYQAIGRLTGTDIPVLATHPRDGQQGPLRAALSAVSRQRAALLRSMGSGASFTSALHSAGRLWGMIVCHSAAECVVAADSWPLVRHIGSALMQRRQLDTARSEAQAMAHVRQFENSFIAALHAEGDVEQVIKSHVSALQRLLRADGFAFQCGHCMYTSGATPPADTIRAISNWAQDRLSADGQFATTSLRPDFPLASHHPEAPCGVLVQSVALPRLSRLIWFRNPAPRTTAMTRRNRPVNCHPTEAVNARFRPTTDCRAGARKACLGRRAISKLPASCLNPLRISFPRRSA